jgi:hypothetical protein
MDPSSGGTGLAATQDCRVGVVDAVSYLWGSITRSRLDGLVGAVSGTHRVLGGLINGYQRAA